MSLLVRINAAMSVVFIGAAFIAGYCCWSILETNARREVLAEAGLMMDSALATLFGSRFRALVQQARNFGLAFASAHLAHLGMVVWMLLSTEKPFPRSSLVFFGVAVFWTYLLALLSVRRLSAMLNPTSWRLVRIVSVEYISYAFIVDFAKNPFWDGAVHLVEYLPFLVLALAGPFLRVAAAVKRVSEARRLSTS